MGIHLNKRRRGAASAYERPGALTRLNLPPCLVLLLGAAHAKLKFRVKGGGADPDILTLHPKFVPAPGKLLSVIRPLQFRGDCSFTSYKTFP